MADALDRVFVDGVVMVHIELHHRDDGGKFRNERAKDAKLVHAAQTPFGVAVFEHGIQKQLGRDFAALHIGVDQMQVG